ncbi:MAG: hypothetical protein AAFX99_32595, partial [Myxococcota bacterium]
MSDDKTDSNNKRFRKRTIPGRLMRTLKTGSLTGALSSSYLGGKLLGHGLHHAPGVAGMTLQASLDPA